MATDGTEHAAGVETTRTIDWDALVEHSEREGSTDLYLFATDALLAYGDDFLDPDRRSARSPVDPAVGLLRLGSTASCSDAGFSTSSTSRG